MSKIIGKGRNTWNDGSVMTYRITDDGILTISGSLDDGYDVRIKASAPFHHVVIEDGITAVGGYNFYGMEQMEEITLPASISSIGEKAFCRCGNLKKINWNEGLLSIGDNAFEDCKSLKEVHVPQSVVSVGKGAFDGCKNLTEAILPKGLKEIKGHTFGGCQSLVHVVLPKELVTIKNMAFSWCPIGNLILPNSFRNMEEGAFYNCKNMIKAVRKDGKFFWGGRFIASGPGDLEYECHITHVNPEKSYTLISPYYSGEEEVILPDEVEYEGRKYRVNAIDREAFYEDKKLVSIVLPEHMTIIWQDAFWGCENLKYVRNGKSIQSIMTHAFDGCRNLEVLEIGDDVSYIGYRAFGECHRLNLPGKGTPGLEYISSCLHRYNGSLPPHSWVEVRKGIKGIAEGAFEGHRNLEGIVLPEGLETIGYTAFMDCSRLRFINLPKSLSYIGDDVFDGTSVTEVTAPWKKPIKIESGSFLDGTTVYIPKGTLEEYRKAKYWTNYKLIEK